MPHRRRDAIIAVSATTVGAAINAPVVAQQPLGGPFAGGRFAGSVVTSGPPPTQPWGQSGRLATPQGMIERVTFQSEGASIVGNLFLPSRERRKPSVIVVGPVGFVKEQAPMQYVWRLMREGFMALAFDPRFHGESGREPRRHESGAEKVKDIQSAVDHLIARPDVDPSRLYVLGVCQGVNWAIESAIADSRVRAIFAGHYLTPEVALMYLGNQGNVDAKIARSR